MITSHSAILFLMFNTVTLYQPKSTSKKWWFKFISSSVIQRSGDVRERTVGNRLSSSEISSYYYMYFLFIYYILYYEQIYTHFDTQKHWRQKVIMQEHILPWTSSNDRVCGQFKTPLHLSAPQQPCARQPWAILITRGSSGPYSMGLHTASSTLHKTVCSQPFFCQYGVGSSLEVPSRS